MSETQDFTVYTLDGPGFVDQNQIDRVGNELTQLVEEKKVTQLVIDFSKVSFVSSMALGMLVAIRKVVQDRNGNMLMMGVKSEGIKKVMKVTRLNQLFPLVDNEDEAKACFEKDTAK